MSKSNRVLAYTYMAVLVIFTAGRMANQSGRRDKLPSPVALGVKAAEAYGNLPLRFEVNEGQSDSRVRFISRGNGYSLFLTPTESVLTVNAGMNCGKSAGHNPGPVAAYALVRPDAQCATAGEQGSAGQLGATAPARAGNVAKSLTGQSAVLRMKLLDANQAPQAKGLGKLPGTSNYFIGNDPKHWRTNVPNYAKVKFEGVYPGVDLVYYGNQQQLEYDFVVAAGANPSAIRFGVSGAEIKVDQEGDLLLSANSREVRWRKPVVYQYIAGKKQYVDGRYRESGTTVGFKVSSYDPRYALVIDPTLVYSTYLGGNSSGEVAAGITVDSAGNAYVTGSTGSTNFPTANAYQGALASNGTSTNAFVTKLNAAGDGVIYSTYLGGSGGGPAYGDGGTGIAVDSAGNAYIAGYTFSSDFPTASSFQSNNAGSGDAFVAKLSATGNALLYSTYIGGSSQDAFPKTSIAVDSSGNAVVAGSTYSSDFPTLNAAQATYGTNGDCFITRLNPSGTVAFSTYFGGNNLDDCEGLALDSSGNIYLTGSSLSSDFPFTGSVGNGHGFVAKLQNSTAGVIYATKLGGISGTNGDAGGGGVAVDSAGNAYVFGGATATDLPITTTAFQGLFGGGVDDTFVMKLDSAGSNLLYCSYLGGSQGEQGIAVAIDAAGHMYVTGNTASPDFPLSNAIQPSYGGGQSDVFVAEFDPLGTTATSLVYSTFLGGTNADHGYAIAVDAAGNAYVAGNTSGGFPTTPGAFQQTYGGSVNDGFVAKIGTIGSSQPANINATSGTSQGAIVGAPVPAPFSATVTDSSGNGVANQTVTFTAPSSGASGSFAGGSPTNTATTNSSGVATSAAFTANTTSGSYTVTASVGGVAGSASFSLTNVDFALSQANPGTVQINAGSSGTTTLNLATAPSGAALPVAITYACTVQTSLTGVGCSVNPTQTTAGSTSGSTTLTITTPSSGAASVQSSFASNGPWPSPMSLILATALGFVLMTCASRQRFALARRRVAVASLALLVTAAGLVSCSSSSKHTGSGTATVTAGAGAVSKTTTINFDVQ